MKVIVSGIVAAALIGGLAAFVLNEQQRSSYQAFSTSSARVGDPGENLVGPRWNGINVPGEQNNG